MIVASTGTPKDWYALFPNPVFGSIDLQQHEGAALTA
jgi:hypothetical protein